MRHILPHSPLLPSASHLREKGLLVVGECWTAAGRPGTGWEDRWNRDSQCRDLSQPGWTEEKEKGKPEFPGLI